MNVGVGEAFVFPRAVAFPSILFGRCRPAFRCYSSSSPDHVSFIKDVAATQAPEHLNELLKILKVRGEEIISPGAKQGLIPLVIPLSRRSSDSATALLRWPTAPSGMEMPLVEVRKYGVWLLAKNVGLFPDVLESRIKQHFDNGDNISALVTGEFYTKKEHFPGFARPFVFNAEVLQKVGRNIEAKDAARGALKSPWWTLGCEYHYIKEKVTEEGREADLKKGKAPAQVALDEAAFLLDLASIDGTWDDCVERIAECYKEIVKTKKRKKKMYLH
ncbi:unnamed protein product [Withania somnifera]